MKVFIRILKVPACILTTALIIFIALFGILHFAMHLDPYIVLSGSMEPEIHVGSIALADHNRDNIKEGEIIVYRLAAKNGNTSNTVTHRVIDTDGETFITKGDANSAEDAKPVLKNQIVGRYRFSIPYAGFIYERLGKGTKLFLIFAGPVLWLLISLFEWGFDDGEDDEEEEAADEEKH